MIRRGVGKETVIEDEFEVFPFLRVKRCLKCKGDVEPGREGGHKYCIEDTLLVNLLEIINEGR